MTATRRVHHTLVLTTMRTELARAQATLDHWQQRTDTAAAQHEHAMRELSIARERVELLSAAVQEVER